MDTKTKLAIELGQTIYTNTIDSLTDKNKKLEQQLIVAKEALEFYANPENYHDISFLADSLCGDFLKDFSEVSDCDRPLPGKLARSTLDSL